MTEQEWGPWIDHCGRGCPLPWGTRCQTQHADGCMGDGISCGHNNSGWSWYVCVSAGLPGDKVIRYRVLTELIEMVETLPERQDA